MDRLVLDLGIERVEDPLSIWNWEYMYIGNCTGDVELKFDNQGWIDPSEFEKMTGVKKFSYLYVSNSVQADEKLVIYYGEAMSWLSRIMR